MIAMAWRSLYAETVRARMDDVALNLKQAVWIRARLTLSRVKAYGAKWYKMVRRPTSLATEQVKGYPGGISQIYAYRVRTTRGLLHLVETTEIVPGNPRCLTNDTPNIRLTTYITVRLLEIEIRLSSLASQFLKCNVKSDAPPASFYL